MSHIEERKEKDCLNCGTIVQGRYCHVCGQENVVPHETFWHMVKHFVYDILHFDSKFYDSMKYLLLKPGFLPLEYIRGRRVSYMNPVKKYVFTSAIFFLFFFGFFIGHDSVKINLDQPVGKRERAALIARAKEVLSEKPGDTMWKEGLKLFKDTSKVLFREDILKYADDYNFIDFSGRSYTDLKEYDSVQKSLPSSEKDGWLLRILQKRNLQLKEKYKNDPRAGSSKLIDTFLHNLPYLLFVSLPIFALFLKILYIRRKKYYYVDHGIFSIYHYIFTFILLFFVFLSQELSDVTDREVFDYLSVILFLSGGIYLYLSMKRFYGQKHLKTILKFILLNIAGFVMLAVLFLVFVFFSVFKI
ncbi:MAG TPA: DUF3667 domain-containing protein [Chitinophagaceae bacterium]|nr:DUF3667 domain-containing protein [Chitinophagaceae bacterium]